MRIPALFKLRQLSYSLAVLLVLAVNANAVASPVTSKIEYMYSHRPEQARQYGTWDVLETPSPVRSVHAALLHTGKVLLVAGSGNDEEAFDEKTFRTVLWDPTTNEFTDIPTPWDAFCAGHAFLPNGNLLVAGGTREYEDLTQTPKQEYMGLPDSYEFNPVTERYQRVSDLTYSRWYPTLVTLTDGDILASSGLDEKGEIIYGHTEIYDKETKMWNKAPNLNRNFPTYPALFLTGDGKLLYTGGNSGYGSATENRTPGLWDLSNNTFTEIQGIEDPDMLETSASVLLPPAQEQKYMVIGGGGVGDSEEATNRTAIIDLLTGGEPTITPGPDMLNPTRYMGAVILPDDTVHVSNGSTGYRNDNVQDSYIYNPTTNEFTRAASSVVGRNYHSEALLLPDGRVATFGSNPIDNSFEMRIEIYSPAYLYNGERPNIVSAPKEIKRGSTVEFQVSSSDGVKTAKLMRPSAVTHTTDVEQRSINLPLKQTSTGISVEVSDNSNILPSGWYMAFITNESNIPSEAYWVRVE